ncbi:MAG: GNAT family N-acetyltransferase [Clostridiales bacterium]|nr:GNAT family N-acetyltransferase [Clostridiales bacterium]
MDLIFRKVDITSEKDIREFGETMDALTSHAEDTELLKKKIAKTNANEDEYLMVAEDRESGRICGSLYAMVMGDFCAECKPFMLVENVAVHKDFQRRGIGKAMFAELEKWAKEKDAHYLMLTSSLNRTDAHEFYRAMDYTEAKGFKKYF